jgi:hypothetical protein
MWIKRVDFGAYYWIAQQPDRSSTKHDDCQMREKLSPAMPGRKQ